MHKQRKHPASVTSERLLDAATRYARQLTEEEKDALTLTRQALDRIAERAKTNGEVQA